MKKIDLIIFSEVLSVFLKFHYLPCFHILQQSPLKKLQWILEQTTKYKKAQGQGTKIITEERFLEMVN